MRGLLQDSPLTLRWLFDRLEQVFPRREVATASDGRVIRRRCYADLARRARRLSGALERAGVGQGERVATLSFNHDDHLEQMLGVTAAGRVYHALNPRLPREELEYIVRHAGDRLAFVDEELLDDWQALAQAADLPTVVVQSPGGAGVLDGRWRDYEHFLESAQEDCAWEELDESAAAALCYTSGTTGAPKGVVYSHRGLVLVSLAWLAADAAALSQADTFLPVVPFFHAQAWALPLTALLAGSRMVLTGSNVSPSCVAGLIARERVTLASGVPTIWKMMLEAIAAGEVRGDALACLDRIVCGGSAVPEPMLRAFDELGVRLVQVWGMTEMSPLGTVSRPRREVAPEDELRYRAHQGQLSPLVALRLVDEDGSVLPWDGESAGEIQVRGPWIADAYLDPSAPDHRMDAGGFSADENGQRWLKTGDIATVDELASVHLVDRAKDLIKSGGEWISSVRLEQLIETHPAVAACAVIAMPHPKWDERPLAIVELRPGRRVAAEELLGLVRAAVAGWQVPDELLFTDELPRNSLGKIDKRALRSAYAGGV
jgi:fatty-acyl-CoA synthase